MEEGLLTGGVGGPPVCERCECGGGLGCLRLRVGLGGLGSAQVGPVRLETLFFFVLFIFLFLFSVFYFVFNCFDFISF